LRLSHHTETDCKVVSEVKLMHYSQQMTALCFRCDSCDRLMTHALKTDVKCVYDGCDVNTCMRHDCRMRHMQKVNHLPETVKMNVTQQRAQVLQYQALFEHTAACIQNAGSGKVCDYETCFETCVILQDKDHLYHKAFMAHHAISCTFEKCVLNCEEYKNGEWKRNRFA